VIWTDTSDETSTGMLQEGALGVLAHTPEVCKGTHLYNGYPAIKDDRTSWGMWTTSA
jgi:hypothetical protein